MERDERTRELVARNETPLRELVEDDERWALPSVSVQNIKDGAVNAGDISLRESGLIGEDVPGFRPRRKVLAGEFTRLFRIGEKRGWNARLAKERLSGAAERNQDGDEGKTRYAMAEDDGAGT